MALEDGRHVTLLVEDATGWRNLCHIVTAAHAHDRDKDEPPPRVPCATLEEHAHGLVCLSGCARQGVHDEAGPASGCCGIFGADHLRVELQRPFHRDDRARNRAPRRAGGAGRACPRSPPATSMRTPARAAPLQDAFVALRNHATLDASEPLRRGNFSHVLASPAAMEARFADDHPRRARRRPASSPTA